MHPCIHLWLARLRKVKVIKIKSRVKTADCRLNDPGPGPGLEPCYKRRNAMLELGRVRVDGPELDHCRANGDA